MIHRLFALLGRTQSRDLRTVIVGQLACAALQGACLAILVPVLRATLGGRPAQAWPWLGALAAIGGAHVVVYHRSLMAGRRSGAATARTLHHAIGDHVGAMPLGWFGADREGGLMRAVTENVIDVIGVPAYLLRPLVNAVATPGAVILVMFAFEWRLALVMLVTLPLVIWTLRLTGRLVVRTDHVVDAAAAEAAGRVVEFARLQPVLRAFGRTGQEDGLLDDALVGQRSSARKQITTVLPGVASFVLAVQAAFTVLLLAGTELALHHSVAVPELLALLVIATRFVEPLLTLADLGGTLRVAENSLERLQSILADPPLPEPRQPLEPAGTDIELDAVGFAYPGGAPVLEQVAFRVPERTTTALVGPSGSGKTTITRLIARFYDVDCGAVRIGGIDVRDLAPATLMAHVSLVFQDVYLFEDTLANNIRVGRPEATEAEVHDAAERARVTEIVDRLPDGWQTQVGEGGARLSGGERQRVAIARALLKDAPIVLLDEATSALDHVNETAIRRALAELARDRTVLVIAHRLDTIASADQIVVLDGGRIVETGRHHDLLAADGRYAALWHSRQRAKGWRISTGARG